MGLIGSLGLLGGGCSEDGITPSCPDAPLYDVRDGAARESAQVVEQRTQAIADGCATPIGTTAKSSPSQNEAGAPGN